MESLAARGYGGLPRSRPKRARRRRSGAPPRLAFERMPRASIMRASHEPGEYLGDEPANRAAHGEREHPSRYHVSDDPPAHRRKSPRRADSHNRRVDRMRGAERNAEPR